jgi:hypothetical protein
MRRCIGLAAAVLVLMGCSSSWTLTPHSPARNYQKAEALGRRCATVITGTDGRKMEVCSLQVSPDSLRCLNVVTREPIAQSTWQISRINFEADHVSLWPGALAGAAAGAGLAAVFMAEAYSDDTTRSTSRRITNAVLIIGGGTLLGGFVGAVAGAIVGGDYATTAAVLIDSTK